MAYNYVVAPDKDNSVVEIFRVLRNYFLDSDLIGNRIQILHQLLHRCTSEDDSWIARSIAYNSATDWRILAMYCSLLTFEYMTGMVVDCHTFVVLDYYRTLLDYILRDCCYRSYNMYFVVCVDHSDDSFDNFEEDKIPAACCWNIPS